MKMAPKSKIKEKYPQEAIKNGMAKKRLHDDMESLVQLSLISGKYSVGKGMGRETFLSTAEENIIVV